MSAVYRNNFLQPNPLFCPCVLNAKRGDLEVYETRDLLSPHPTRPGFWKVYGRSDDQIMHSTGEKVSCTAMKMHLLIEINTRADESRASR